ncbi:hypothetical protein FDZ71_02175, partial [bacterium]
WVAGMLSQNSAIHDKNDVVRGVAAAVVKEYGANRLDATVAARTAKAYQLVYFRSQIKSLRKKLDEIPPDYKPERRKRFENMLAGYERRRAELKKLSSSLDIIDYLARYYTEDMAAEFDPAFFILFKQLSYRFFPNLCRSLRISEAEPGVVDEIKRVAKEHPVIFLPNHMSNADHVPICLALNAFGLPQPKIAAGANLFRGVSALALPRLNAYKIRREYVGEGGFFREIKWFQNPIYRRVHTEYLRWGWDHNEPLMFYPEGTRSRDGRMGKPKLGIMADIFAYARELEKTMYLVPVSLSYTIVPEDKEIEAGRTGKEISHRDLLSQLAHLDKQYKEYSRSEIDVRFSAPVELTAATKSRGKMAEDVMATVAKNIAITPTYRLAYALVKRKDEKGAEIFSAETIREEFAVVGP